MSVYRGRPEVTGARSKWREWPRLCENSDVQLARRNSIWISSMWKPIVLATSFGRRQLRKQFYASLAHPRFHTASTHWRPSAMSAFAPLSGA